jgi:hypothetical protein
MKKLLQKNLKIFLYITLLVFIVLDLSHSFRQYKVHTLDGDIAESVLPYSDIQKTFDDPTGIKTIINNDKHLGPNRFFAHYFMYITFNKGPLLLRNYYEPVESVYLTAAISKLLIQIAILLLLAIIVSGSFNFFSTRFMIAAAIITPFILTNGYRMVAQIGIIDISVTYTFFYALPLIFFLLYYLPIIFELIHDKKIKMNGLMIVLWSIFAIVSCFSCPINSPIIVIINSLLFLFLFFKAWQTNNNNLLFSRAFICFRNISRRNYLFLIPITILALYSTFLGTYNNAFSDIQLSLKQLYSILPRGIWKNFTSEGYLVLAALLIINFLMISLKYSKEAHYKTVRGLYFFLITYSIIYILLLPFGGYRLSRPLLLRYDTVMHITVLSIITISYTIIFISKFLMKEKWYGLKIVYPAVLLFFVTFLLANGKICVYNDCEKASLHIIANSEEDVVALDNNCAVLSWGPLSTPEVSSWFRYDELLYLWNITDKPKQYYNLQH